MLFKWFGNVAYRYWRHLNEYKKMIDVQMIWQCCISVFEPYNEYKQMTTFQMIWKCCISILEQFKWIQTNDCFSNDLAMVHINIGAI